MEIMFKLMSNSANYLKIFTSNPEVFWRIKDFDQEEVHLEELLAMVANW